MPTSPPSATKRRAGVAAPEAGGGLARGELVGSGAAGGACGSPRISRGGGPALHARWGGASGSELVARGVRGAGVAWCGVVPHDTVLQRSCLQHARCRKQAGPRPFGWAARALAKGRSAWSRSVAGRGGGDSSVRREGSERGGSWKGERVARGSSGGGEFSLRTSRTRIAVWVFNLLQRGLRTSSVQSS